MTNWDIEAAWHYHNGTKHPDGYLMNPGHRFDPMQQPALFKTYTDLKPIPLSVDVSTGSVPALAAISSDAVHAGDQRIPDVHMLARVLYFSACITKKIAYQWGEMLFRAAACTGALYHIELYVVCGDIQGLVAGVYDFDCGQQALRPLREGGLPACTGGGRRRRIQCCEFARYDRVYGCVLPQRLQVLGARVPSHLLGLWDRPSEHACHCGSTADTRQGGDWIRR